MLPFPPIAAAPAAAPVFAPPEGRRLTVSVEQQRVIGKDSRRFTVQRQIVFRRTTGGWDADLTDLGAHADRHDDAGQRFERTVNALRGRTLHFHLDVDGRVVSLDDQPAVWTIMAGALDALPKPQGVATMPRFGAMAAADQLRILSSSLVDLVMTSETAATPGARPATIHAAPLSGQPMTLTGTQTVTRHDGLVTLTTDAAGSTDTATQRIERSRTIDTRTGLLNEQVEVQTITAGGARQAITSTTRVIQVS